MRRSTPLWLSIAGLAILAAPGAWAGQPVGPSEAASLADAVVDPLAEPPAATLFVDRDRHERMTVPVTINGHGPYRFLVDTGSQATVVTAQVTDALGLVPTGRSLLVAMASRSMVETITLDGLEFAGRRFNNLTAPLLRDVHVGADGVIGLDSLQALRVIMDFRADRITVGDAPAGDRSGFEIVVRARRKLGQMIIADARVGGVRTAVIIDTGSWHSFGNRALQRRLRSKQTDTMTSTDVAGAALHSDIAVVSKVQIGKMVMARVPIGFVDSPAFPALDLDDTPALILGMANLRPFERVAIDFASQRVLFDVPRGIDADPLGRLFSTPRAPGG